MNITMDVGGVLPMEAKDAELLILAGKAPDGICVIGGLSLVGKKQLTRLPRGLKATSIDLSGCENLSELPADLQVRRLNVSGCTALKTLPPSLRLFELEARELVIEVLPDDIRVENRLDLSDCIRLQQLPTGFKVGSLILKGCVAIERLPEKLDVCFLDLSGCTSLKQWPETATVAIGALSIAGCVQLESIPPWLQSLSQLNLHGCSRMSSLPQGLQISSWLDLAETEIKSLPNSLLSTPLRWKGVPIDARIAFEPETITADEIIREQNAERRRVLMERLGYEKFLEQTRAKVIDQDRDPGGARQLLRVDLQGDEPLVCLAVSCPSTARRYMLRVPPTTRSCHQAAAWIAGFDDASLYQPIAET